MGSFMTLMNRGFGWAIASVISIAIGGLGTGWAADLAVKAPPLTTPAPASNWTGFYIGVNGGGGWGSTDWLFTGPSTIANHDISGGLAGGQIGYNWQTGAWVFGVEADGDWADIKGSTPCPNPAFVCASNVRDLASFRGRIGYTSGPLLVYGTGGVGYTNAHYSGLTVVGGLPSFASTGVFNDDRWGYAAGFGVEWGFAPNWSAKLEYMHYGFGTDTAPPATLSLSPSALRLNVDTVKAGVNYHFNWASPVVARY
jgi:outer membrane immunogenic protein